MPKFGVSEPKIKTPDYDLETPEMDLSAPKFKANFDYPDLTLMVIRQISQVQTWILISLKVHLQHQI